MKVTVRRIHLDSGGYARRSGPLAGVYFGGGAPLYYCPELDVYFTSLASQCTVRAVNHHVARAVFQARLQEGKGCVIR